MLRNLTVALIIVVIGGSALWYFSGQLSAPSDTSEWAPMENTKRAGNSESVLSIVEDETEVAVEGSVLSTEEWSLHLGHGEGGLVGTIRGENGELAKGSKVTLYRADLADFQRQGGASSWELMQRGRMRTGNLGLNPQLMERIEPLARVRTGEDGRYQFEGLAAGQFLVAARTKNSLQSPAQELSFLDSDGQGTSDVLLVDSGRLEGRVVDRDYEPVHLAELEIDAELIRPEEFRSGGNFLSFNQVNLLLLNPTSRELKTDKNGQFVVSGLPFFNYRIRVIAAPLAEIALSQDLAEQEPLEIVLGEGGEVSGVVTDSAGNAIVGMLINLRTDGNRMSFMSGRASTRREAESDSDGRFKFGGLPAGSYRLSSEGSGYLDNSLRGVVLEVGEEKFVELELEEAHLIAGVVLDQDGQAIVDGAVRATLRREDDGEGNSRRRRGRGRGFDAKTDAQGQFVLDRLPEGTYSLRIRATTYVPSEVEAVTGTQDVRVQLQPGFKLTGKLVDDQQQAIAGASVRVGQGWNRAGRTRTDGQGNFVLEGLAEEVVDLRLRAKGFRDQTFEAEFGELGEVVMETAPRLEGFVFAPDGSAVMGARVRAQVDRGDENRGSRRAPRNFSRGRSSTFTDEEGHFILELGAEGELWDLTANAKGYLDGELADVQVRSAVTDGLEIRLGRAASMSGRTTAADGQPLSGAQVSLQRAAENNSGQRSRGRNRFRSFASMIIDRTDTEGRYELDGIEPGLYNLQASAKGYATGLLENLELSEGTATLQDMTLDAEKQLVGSIVDNLGQPIAGARIRVTGDISGFQSATTSIDGRFVVSGLAADLLTVEVSAEGYSRTRLQEIIADAGELTIELEQSYSVLGLIADSLSGQVIAGARITVRPRAALRSEELGSGRGMDRGGRGNRRGRSDADGQFEVTRVEAGTYDISITATDFLPITLSDIAVPGSASQSLVVNMMPGARIVGQLVNKVGAPIEGASISATLILGVPGIAIESTRPAPRVRNPRIRSDADGRFQLTGLEDGSYQVKIVHPEYVERVISEVNAQTGVDTSLKEILIAGSIISGRIFDETGRRILVGRVRVTGAGLARAKSGALAADGQYRIAGLAAGTYDVSYYEGRGSRTALATGSVSIRDDQEKILDLRREN